MDRLWVPPSANRRLPRVSDELVRGTKDHNEQVSALERTNGLCEQFNRELRKIDADLKMVFFEAQVPVGGVPYRYHLVRRPAVGPKTLISITGPHGEFVEPTSAIFEQLRKGDLWNGEAERFRKRSEREAELALERQKAREQEERQEELKDRYNAAFRTSVSMLPGWTQNAAGRRKIKR
jgi:hypothetical protein